jgi:hypothetical protein
MPKKDIKSKEKKTKKTTIKDSIKSEDIKADSSNTVQDTEKAQENASKSENTQAKSTDSTEHIEQVEGIVDQEEQLEEEPIIVNKVKVDNRLDEKEIAFIKKLFKRYSESSIWDKFWSGIAVLLVLCMFYLIYLFLKTAGTIPFTHWRII